MISEHSFRWTYCFMAFVALSSLWACQSSTSNKVSASGKYGADVVDSYIHPADSTSTPPFLQARLQLIDQSLRQSIPVMRCGDSLSTAQREAESIALANPMFTKQVREDQTQAPQRNEIFGVYPARESDMQTVRKGTYQLSSCFRVEMYNYARNLTTVAVVDNSQQKVLAVSTLAESQPDIPAYLKQLAIQLAVESAAVQEAYGIKPTEAQALMASTKTALNRSRCERSRHLCVAPTFIKNDKALWAIVDLTDHRLVGVRWTNTGTTGPVRILTERKLQDEKVTACFCEASTKLERDGWKLDYMLTSSDGLQVSDVQFNGKPILQNAKLVDWHVSYSGTDGFGYSDAVGCPYFSQAAVIAFQPPQIASLKDDQNNVVGFVLEQVFRSELWPQPCNYNYKQRFEFYLDGRFRVAAASLGRGCGNDGTYRPVFRIAFAPETRGFSAWDGQTWKPWQQEQWVLQEPSAPTTPEGYGFQVGVAGQGYYIMSANGQMGDGGRGDRPYVYVTRNKPGVDEGHSDLVTIGPCCNTDYKQGPEKFIEPKPESLEGAAPVVWYVAQMRNDNSKGREYCWAESVLEQGRYVTKVYPCFCGPMFIPVK